MLDYKGKRFLVAPRGETQWVKNARASSEVWLKKGRSRRQYGLRGLEDREKTEILKEYPQLQEADILACIAYGSEMSRERYVAIPTEADA